MIVIMSEAKYDCDTFDDPDNPGYCRVPQHLWTYAYDHSELAEAAADLHRFLADLATEASIRFHTIESRAKTLKSYRDKSLKQNRDGTPKYPDPAHEIRDCVAARVILFTSQARDDFAALLERRAQVFERLNPGSIKHNGYDSEHFIITALSDPSAANRYSALVRFLGRYSGLEVQLRSVAAHAWAEYEHDVRYKSAAYSDLSADDKAQIDQWFIEAGGMRRVMDDVFDKVQALLYPTNGDGALRPVDDSDEDVATEVDEEQAATRQTTTLDTATLADFSRARYPESPAADASAVSELLNHLLALGVHTVDELEASLAELDVEHLARLMDYPTEPTGLRRLDDELLAVFTDRYVESASDDDRARLLRLRLGRVRGKFAIYSIFDGERARRPVTAARAVRDLAALVAREGGLESALVQDAIAGSRTELLPSSKPRPIGTTNGTLFVATNFSRAWAEKVMQQLVDAVPESGFRVTRAGDVICSAGTSVRESRPRDGAS